MPATHDLDASADGTAPLVQAGLKAAAAYVAPTRSISRVVGSSSACML